MLSLKKRLELFLAGIILFPIIFGSLSFVMLLIVVPMEPYYIDIRINELYGLDDNNDTQIDTIGVILSNSGLKTEEIIRIDISNKNWNLTSGTYPIELLAAVTNIEIILTATTDQDQINSTDNFVIEFYFMSEGQTNPGIMIDNTEIDADYFELKNNVIKSFHKDNPKNLYDLLYLSIAIISILTSFSPLTIYLIVIRYKQRNNEKIFN